MYHLIRNNIESACNLYRTFGRQISADQDITCELERLKKLIQETQEAFASTGISAACKKCGEHSQHCCRAGTENQCDDVLLFINLLLHPILSHQPRGSTACGFLGEKGCTLVARPVICLNYLCQPTQQKIAHKRLIAVQQAIGRELDLQFILCEKIKAKIKARRTSHPGPKK
jgi:hypothetical protein